MTVLYEASQRGWTSTTSATLCLEDKYEVMKEIGDGSFGSVSLARVRTAGANVARRGTMVAVKTMKKTFDSFNHCLELREVIFLRSLPGHPHLVPALDVFLDPITKRLHIAMEYMDGNLYQLMKARDRKYLDGPSVKSILFQIISGLEHIHAHAFFHRDIKPENILVSTSAPQDSGSAFKRYSQLVTPPTTPPAYTIKIADFGLARETQSKLPYTTYVSTRWYRAPEVLLRAGEYSAPVDIWAVGAMAVEIATLKPLFPGSNEVDQVWRVCEIMGSPGNWVNKNGQRVGGGEWKDGVKLASKLGFTFPKMAPHSLDTILVQPTWPASLSDFVTWCLMWDPKNRPTSTQALAHEFFRDAVDPLKRPKSSSKLLGRKQSTLHEANTNKESTEHIPTLSTKSSSWFRRSLIQRELSAPAITQHAPAPPVQAAPQPVPPMPTMERATTLKVQSTASKRATWTHGLPANAAPIPILPTIRPVSPMSDAVTAQAAQRDQYKTSRQTPHSHQESHRQEAERALTGQSGLTSPTSSQKESFFSHLRKRARRFSGRYQTPMSPSDDIESNASSSHWSNTRHSQAFSTLPPIPNDHGSEYTELDKALQGIRTSMDATQGAVTSAPLQKQSGSTGNSVLKRHHSTSSKDRSSSTSRSRKAQHKQSQPNLQYETPDEEDEILDEALNSARNAATHLDYSRTKYSSMLTPEQSAPEQRPNQYLITPSPSANRKSIGYGHTDYQGKKQVPSYAQTAAPSKWPTPPYDNDYNSKKTENWDTSEWAKSTMSSIFASNNF
ncbi:kinase-like protein [Microthyrium microscopicum]|uniref:Kinase-like protein n=1 Tax=Microthyrium microscopicum TaxID=703497 RepID=A0A6A6U667_9PEZI|nr:kinase-like protein [Microthyrium microscopicum]